MGRTTITQRWLGLAAALVGCAATACGADETAGDHFGARIAPLLASRCGSCHGATDPESGYRVDLRSAAMAGGDSGRPGIVPGQPEESEFFVRVTTADHDARMPAKADPLPSEERALLEAWIRAGAPWPDAWSTLPATMMSVAAAASARAADHWAFQPVVRPPVPRPPGGPFPNPIDAFLAEGLAARGLGFNPEADPVSLVRRLFFDLVGLPPSPEEIAAFTEACRMAGGSDRPYEELVNRLLASPNHGERWARHWLDVVRFAESDGFETNTARTNAWPYRDWVIASLNADLPFDRFIKAQLVGDASGDDAATGFLVAGAVDRVKSPDPVLTATQRADELHDMVGTTAAAFLGLTVGCARCHDHKFDPVPQTDYYRIKAVFEGVEHGERSLDSPAEAADRRQRLAEAEQARGVAAVRLFELLSSGSQPALRAQVGAGENIERFPATPARHLRFTIRDTTGPEPCLDELEVFSTDAINVARAARPSASGVFGGGGNPLHQIEHVNDGVYGNGNSWISSEPRGGWVQLDFDEVHRIERVHWSRDRSPLPQYADRVPTRYEVAVSLDGDAWTVVASDADRIPFGNDLPPLERCAALSPNERAEAERLHAVLADLDARIGQLRTAPLAYLGTFRQPAPTHRLFRGDPLAAREAIPPGSLSAIGEPWELPLDAPERDRRQALADWVASTRNPLAARVIVNRLWHHHFGTGIVETPSDFGVHGGRPSHPELLDWLAAELVDGGWRLKALHKRIVMSRGYRQESTARPEAVALDAADRLLWRYPPRRLEAEPLRDAILAVSGSLDPRMGGPGFDLFEPNTNYVKVYLTKTSFTPDDFRRMIYQAKPRSELDSFFGVFDCPDAAQSQPARTVSTTPLQAFNMLHGEFLLDQAERFAARVEREAGPDPTRQVTRAMLLAFGREPSPEERVDGEALVRAHGLPILCRSLYNASEFITVP